MYSDDSCSFPWISVHVCFEIYMCAPVLLTFHHTTTLHTPVRTTPYRCTTTCAHTRTLPPPRAYAWIICCRYT